MNYFDTAWSSRHAAACAYLQKLVSNSIALDVQVSLEITKCDPSYAPVTLERVVTTNYNFSQLETGKYVMGEKEMVAHLVSITLAAWFDARRNSPLPYIVSTGTVQLKIPKSADSALVRRVEVGQFNHDEVLHIRKTCSCDTQV